MRSMEVRSTEVRSAECRLPNCDKRRENRETDLKSALLPDLQCSKRIFLLKRR